MVDDQKNVNLFKMVSQFHCGKDFSLCRESSILPLLEKGSLFEFRFFKSKLFSFFFSGRYVKSHIEIPVQWKENETYHQIELSLNLCFAIW